MTDRILEVLADAKRIAQEYRGLTGKPLAITGEVAEFEAARDPQTRANAGEDSGL